MDFSFILIIHESLFDEGAVVKLIFPALAAVLVILMATVHYFRIQAEKRMVVDDAPALWKDEAFRNSLEKSGKLGVKGIMVVAPSSGLKEESLKKAREIAEYLHIRFPEDAVRQAAVPYTANNDDTRLELLQQALNDPDVEVLWALRGGYGSGRLLPSLAQMTPPKTRKIVVGYSDVTFLHLLFQSWGWQTIHGAMFWELYYAGNSKNVENLNRLTALLAGDVKELRYTGLKPLNQHAKNSTSPIMGILCGGNLTCLAAAAGTPWALKGEGKIVLLEDVDEAGYKVDRLLTQMRDSGALDGVAAILLGEFTGGDEALELALKRFAEDFSAPVFQSPLFGHGKDNFPLLFNAQANVTADREEAGTFVLTNATDALP